MSKKSIKEDERAVVIFPEFDFIINGANREFKDKCLKCMECFSEEGTFRYEGIQKCRKVSKTFRWVYRLKKDNILIAEYPVLIAGEKWP